MRLVEFSNITKEQYLDYIIEWETKKQLVIPGASDRKGRAFEDMMKIWNEDKSDDAFTKGFVPSTLYFLLSTEDKIVGSIHLRQVLNDKLLLTGGNIGYGVRPSERNKGYGALMLKFLLEKLKRENYDKVLLTCDDENISSIRTIEKNNGVLENKIMHEGKIKRRYWIEIKER